MKRPPHVRALVDGFDVRWYGIHPADKHLIKRLPRHERWWSRALYCWITPDYDDVIDLVCEALEHEGGYTVAVVDVSRHIEPRDWHQVYRERFGYDCPHRKSKTTEQRVLPAREPISTTEWKEAA